MKIQTRALVIHSLKYGDNSLIVRCFTRDYGPVSYLLKNILSGGKNKKIRASLFQPLAILELTATHKNKGTLEYLSEARIAYFPQTLYTQMSKSSVLVFLTEVLNSCLKNESVQPEMFDYVVSQLTAFDQAPLQPDFHLTFLAELSKYLGFYPDFEGHSPYFNLLEGQLTPFFTSPYCLNEEETQNFRTVFGVSEGVKFKNHQQRNETLEALLKYYSLYVAGFSYPKSVSILREIFTR